METHSDILRFYPNFIEYIRMILLGFAMWFVNTNWKLCIFSYCISFGLDVIDGPIARKMNQVTRFGASLDMLCDKASTPTLLFSLASKYPDLSWLFISCILLDITSHYFLLQVTPLLKHLFQ